jgi:hypothetical protein
VYVALIPATPDDDAVKVAEQLAVPAVDPATRLQGEPVIDPVTFSLSNPVPPGV